MEDMNTETIGNTTDNTNSNDSVSQSNQTVADNSESNENLEQQISDVLDEPRKTVEENEKQNEQKQVENKDNNPIKDCPEKFKNKDGSVNIENVLKSYKELEPLIQEKANWAKERAELLELKKQIDEENKLQEDRARQAGYESLQDMEQVYQIASLEANEYAKYLEYTDDAESVRQMLIEYMNNPSPELMEDIELEFAPEINKRVAIIADRQKRQFENDKATQAESLKMSAIENVITQSVNKSKELFNYAPFKTLFVNTLTRFGDSFTVDDANALIDMMTQMKELYKAEFEKQTGAKLQNEAATDKLAAINNSVSAPAASQKTITNQDIENMSESELAKEIRKLI